MPALQREDQVRGGAGPGAGARLRRGGHRSPRPAVRRRAAPLGRPGQGPVVRAGGADPRRSWRTRCSRSATRPRPRCGRRRPRRGLAVADKPDSHDICFVADGDTRGFLRRPARRPAGTAGRRADRRGGRPARRRVRLHGRAAARAAAVPAGGRRPARGTCSASSRSAARVDRRPGRAARRHRGQRRPSGVDRRVAAGGRLRLLGAAAGARVGGAGGGRRDARRRWTSGCRRRCAASRPARRSSSTPATPCSAPRRSPSSSAGSADGRPAAALRSARPSPRPRGRGHGARSRDGSPLTRSGARSVQPALSRRVPPAARCPRASTGCGRRRRAGPPG